MPQLAPPNREARVGRAPFHTSAAVIEPGAPLPAQFQKSTSTIDEQRRPRHVIFAERGRAGHGLVMPVESAYARSTTLAIEWVAIE